MMLRILSWIYAIDGLQLSLTLPVMNPYIISLGGNQFYVGVMGSISALIALLWNPVAGSLGDTHGQKLMLLQCLGVCLLGNLLLLTTNSLVTFSISRIICAFGCPVVGLVKTLLAKNVKSSENQSAALHKFTAMSTGFFIVGSLFSGYLSKQPNGTSYVFLTICMMFVLNIGLVLSLPASPSVPKKQHKQDKTFNGLIKSEMLKTIAKLKNIDWTHHREVFTIKLCTELAYGIFQSCFSIMAIQKFGATGQTLGYMIAFMGAVGIVANLLMSRVNHAIFRDDKSGYSRLMGGMILLCITFTCISMSHNFYLFMIFMAPFVVARSFLESTMNEILLSKASAADKGGIVGAFDSIMSFSGLTTPLISAILAVFLGQEITLFLSSVPVCIGLLSLRSLKMT